jgi:hypothetical protein
MRRVLSLQQIADLIDAATTGPVVENVSGAGAVADLPNGAGVGPARQRAAQLHMSATFASTAFSSAPDRQEPQGRVPVPAAVADERAAPARASASQATEKVFTIAENTARMLKADLERGGHSLQDARRRIRLPRAATPVRVDARQRGRSDQGGSGAHAPRQHPHDDGHLRAPLRHRPRARRWGRSIERCSAWRSAIFKSLVRSTEWQPRFQT